MIQLEDLITEGKPKAGDYVKTAYGVGVINKVRGAIAYMKLPDGGDWMNNIKFLKPTGKKEKGKNLWTEGKLTEASGGGKEKVYMLNGMLWFSYSPNSGRTTRIRGRGWITDQSSEKNFDGGVKDLAKWSKYQKPIKKKTASNGSKVSLFKIPEYSGGDAKEYDIWGGDEKPKKWAYLLVSIGKKINVISVFRSKPEAMSWIGHTA